MEFILKTLSSALIIAAISTVAKRSTIMAAILASLPLTSILAMIWLYYDEHDLQKISELSMSTFWLVVPSLLFFMILPVLIKNGVRFGFAMALSSLIMVVGYSGYIVLLKSFGVKF